MAAETILVVDQDLAELETVAMSLTARGYRVVTATGGDEAVEIAAHERPRVVVVNGKASKATGDLVCRQLKATADASGIRVLMLTGRPNGFETFWGMKQGADAYLAEPFARDELVYNVNRLV